LRVLRDFFNGFFSFFCDGDTHYHSESNNC
jgi:hypothetical protein